MENVFYKLTFHCLILFDLHAILYLILLALVYSLIISIFTFDLLKTFKNFNNRCAYW